MLLNKIESLYMCNEYFKIRLGRVRKKIKTQTQNHQQQQQHKELSVVWGGWYNCEFSVIPLPIRAGTGKGWPIQAWTGKGRPGAMAGIDNNK